MQKVIAQIGHTLDAYEDELGLHSRGLAYLQKQREELFIVLNKEADYRKFLEARLKELYKDNENLRNKIQMPYPNLNIEMKDIHTIANKSFEWRLETVSHLHPVREHEKWSVDFWKRVRWQSYRGFLKLFRKQFDENFKRYMEISNQ